MMAHATRPLSSMRLSCNKIRCFLLNKQVAMTYPLSLFRCFIGDKSKPFGATRLVSHYFQTSNMSKLFSKLSESFFIHVLAKVLDIDIGEVLGLAIQLFQPLPSIPSYPFGSKPRESNIFTLQ